MSYDEKLASRIIDDQAVEIERLQAENEWLRDDKGCALLDARDEIEQLQADFNDCNSERARWRAEAERLRAVLRDAQTAVDERWGAIGSPPHLVGQIREVLGDEQKAPTE
jgi:hypothetical protein